MKREIEKMYCPKCGEQLKNKALYCPKCGYKLELHSNDNCCEARVVIRIVGLAGVIMICALFFLLGKSSSVDDSISSSVMEHEVQREHSVENVNEETMEEKELTLEEEIEQLMKLNEEGKITEADKKYQQVIEKYAKNVELYFLLEEMFIKKGDIEDAKECLLVGFEQTEDESLMEEFLDISLEYVSDGNGAEYKILLELVELYAQATGNEEKFEIAKRAYFLFRLQSK